MSFSAENEKFSIAITKSLKMRWGKIRIQWAKKMLKFMIFDRPVPLPKSMPTHTWGAKIDFKKSNDKTKEKGISFIRWWFSEKIFKNLILVSYCKFHRERCVQFQFEYFLIFFLLFSSENIFVSKITTQRNETIFIWTKSIDFDDRKEFTYFRWIDKEECADFASSISQYFSFP